MTRQDEPRPESWLDAVPADDPSPGFAERVVDAWDQERPGIKLVEPPVKKPRFLLWAGAAMAAAAAGFLVFLLSSPDPTTEEAPKTPKSPVVKLSEITPDEVASELNELGDIPTLDLTTEAIEDEPEKEPSKRRRKKRRRNLRKEDKKTLDEELRMGIEHAKKKDYKKAVRHLKRAIEISPEDAEAHKALGIVYAYQGSTKRALREYETFLKLSPHHRNALQVRKIIEDYYAEKGAKRGDKGRCGGSEVFRVNGEATDCEKRPDLPGPPTKAEIMQAMKKYVPALRGCVHQQSVLDPRIIGILKASFTVHPDGSVQNVKMSWKHKETYVEGCLGYIIGKIRFPEFDGKPVRIPMFPFKIGPGLAKR